MRISWNFSGVKFFLLCYSKANALIDSATPFSFSADPPRDPPEGLTLLGH